MIMTYSEGPLDGTTSESDENDTEMQGVYFRELVLKANVIGRTFYIIITNIMRIIADGIMFVRGLTFVSIGLRH